MRGLGQQTWRALMVLRAVSAKLRGTDTPREQPGRKRVTVVQFGDFAEAFQRFQRGGEQDYYAQKYSVEFMSGLAQSSEVESTNVICVGADIDSQILPNGIQVTGIDLYRKDARPRFAELVELVRLTRPTHLVVRSPILPLFRWALRERVALLPLLADSFRGGGLRKRLRHRELALTLNHPAICIVANHNIAASLDLHHIGVDNRKIVPYDWPAETSPRDFPAKKAPAPGQPFRLLYVGSIIETKGVGDLITAVALLRQQGRNVTLTIIGSGDVQQYRAMVARKGLVDDVTFAGKQPHSVVMAEMHAHGAVVVPSHSAYPEGLPMTLYEAICSRTPLLASDHPMFALRLRDGVNSLVFRERNPSSIAECVQRLMDSPSLYEHLSESAERTAEQYLCPLKFADLISAFLDPSRRAELGRFSIAHGMSA